MPTFETRGPISISIELGVGNVAIEASERSDTIVEVRASRPEKKAGVATAEQTRVDFANGVLSVKSPRGWRHYGLRNGGDSIEVRLQVPAGSQLRGESGMGVVHATGRLGDCSYKTGMGDIDIEEAAAVQLKTGFGDISVGRVGGDAELATGSGDLRAGVIDGGATIKDSNGAISVGSVAGDVHLSSANGRIVVDRAGSSVSARTANGDVRLGEVARGEVVAHTARGEVSVGVRDGVAAWLDLNTSYGNVRSDLEPSGRPADGTDSVQVRARTAFGDITIRRCALGGDGDDQP